ncbi:MAG: hypothetical protein QOF57_2211 [Frankiaceae bacterium]|jgi:uncharacterized protein YbcI|nr:hypothetical protein [Frankiaceae bacterium]
MADTHTTTGMAAQISDGIVRLHKEFYGKGPNQAKTYLVNDTVVCMLRGGFTTVERTLIDDGKSEDVERIRRSFQTTMRGAFIHVVEDAMTRKVVAYMSQVHTDPDLAVELFVLEPHDEPIVEEHELATIDA